MFEKDEMPEGCKVKLDKLNQDILENASQETIDKDLIDYQRCLKGENE